MWNWNRLYDHVDVAKLLARLKWHQRLCAKVVAVAEREFIVFFPGEIPESK